MQVVGVYAYDLDGWNNRTGYLVLDQGKQPVRLYYDAPAAATLARSLGGRVAPVSMNVDFAVHRRRLWSLNDNQIGYYLTHWRESHAHKEELIAGRLTPFSIDTASTIANAGPIGTDALPFRE